MTLGSPRQLLGMGLAFAIIAAAPLRAGQTEPPTAVLAKADALIKEKKYLSAATLLQSDRTLLDNPAVFMKYINLLTDYYVITINGRILALKDLDPEETIESIRGKQGNYRMMGGDIEEVVAEKFRRLPNSPEIRFAVGKYLAFRNTCCGPYGETSPFGNPRQQEFDSFKFAYDHQIYDWWSLFRMGVRTLEAPSEPPSLAIGYLEKARVLNPEDLDVSYNLAVALHAGNRHQEALACIDRVVGRYKSGSLNADAYHVKGRTLDALGKKAEALDCYKKSLQESAWHPGAFQDLLGAYRDAGLHQEYASTVLTNLARDYANPLFFNYYVGFLRDHGTRPVDDAIETDIAALVLPNGQAAGAVYFNLGKLSLIKGNKVLAKERFLKALESFRKMPSPPPGAVKSIQSILQQLP